MKYSWRRVLDGLAIALLVFVIVCQVRGALGNNAPLLSVVISIICLLCSVGIYRNNARVKMVTGCLLIIMAGGVALVAWRLHMPVLISILLSSIFATVGIGLIYEVRKR